MSLHRAKSQWLVTLHSGAEKLCASLGPCHTSLPSVAASPCVAGLLWLYLMPFKLHVIIGAQHTYQQHMAAVAVKTQVRAPPTLRCSLTKILL
jgi:hypothetical protein